MQASEVIERNATYHICSQTLARRFACVIRVNLRWERCGSSKQLGPTPSSVDPTSIAVDPTPSLADPNQYFAELLPKVGRTAAMFDSSDLDLGGSVQDSRRDAKLGRFDRNFGRSNIEFAGSPPYFGGSRPNVCDTDSKLVDPAPMLAHPTSLARPRTWKFRTCLGVARQRLGWAGAGCARPTFGRFGRKRAGSRKHRH